MEGLLQAHDSIASLTDRVYCSPQNMNTMPAKIPLHQSLSNSLHNEGSKGYNSSTEDIKKVSLIQRESMSQLKISLILEA
jgi:hypothetical protein